VHCGLQRFISSGSLTRVPQTWRTLASCCRY